MKTEKEIRDMLSRLTDIMNNPRLRASQMVTFQELLTLRWVLGEYEGWHDETFEFLGVKT